MKSILEPMEIFGEVRNNAPVIVAVSGGSDSIALLNLASSWAKATNTDLRVVTVDHGLRPEAAAEAAFVAGVCEGLELQHYTLTWEGLKPVTGISESAREARYRLMEEFAKDIGAAEILVGHTSDDQAETVWMRNSRSGGNPQWRGLAGIPYLMTLASGIMVRRPLLGFSRRALRDHLAELGQSWIEDPSNHDMSYERVRARDSLTESDISKNQICRLANLAGRLRAVYSEEVSEILSKHLQVKNGPVFVVSIDGLKDANPNVATLLVQVMIAVSGGRPHFIPFATAEEVLALSNDGRMSAGYTIIERSRSSLRFYRENRNLATMYIPPFSDVLWDNRLLVENTTDRSFFCSPMDMNRVNFTGSEFDARFDVKPRAALKGVPVISSDDGYHFIPFVNASEQESGLKFDYKVPAIEQFCSGYDVALLRAVENVRSQLAAAQVPPEYKT